MKNLYNTKDVRPTAVARKLTRALSPYKENDGAYVHLMVLKSVFPPNIRWDLYLLGMTSTNHSNCVMRTKPLLGRLICRGPVNDVVVLLDSLRAWLDEYNQDNIGGVESAIEMLLEAEKRHLQLVTKRRKEATIQSQATCKELKKFKKDATRSDGRNAKPPSATSNELWKVWA